MLSELGTRDRLVGLKQLQKALSDGRAAKVFVADNADPALTGPIVDQCSQASIPVEHVPTMAELGRACGIEVGASVAATLRPMG